MGKNMLSVLQILKFCELTGRKMEIGKTGIKRRLQHIIIQVLETNFHLPVRG